MRQGRPPCHQYFESSVQNLVVKRSTALEKKTRVRVVAASGSRFRAPMNALACTITTREPLSLPLCACLFSHSDDIATHLLLPIQHRPCSENGHDTSRLTKHRVSAGYGSVRLIPAVCAPIQVPQARSSGFLRRRQHHLRLALIRGYIGCLGR